GGVVVALVGQRADQDPEVAPLCQPGKVFADADAWSARGEGPELAADALGGGGLQVEAVVLGQPAGEEDVDAGAGLRRLAGSPQGGEGGEVALAQAEQAGGPGLEGGAAGEGRVLEGGGHGPSPAGCAHRNSPGRGEEENGHEKHKNARKGRGVGVRAGAGV